MHKIFWCAVDPVILHLNMRKMVNILGNSLRLTFQELMVNKLRTALSLIGISFGIFCIIGVLATVNSLEKNIQKEIAGLGTNTIYIDKWDYSGGPDYPWWKFVNRPLPKYEEVNFIKQRSQLASNVAFNLNNTGKVEFRNSILQNVTFYGITEEKNEIQPQLILLDVFLTGIDGLDICRQLKANPNTKDIPIIIFSAYPRVAQKVIYEYGADDFIAKPFEMEDLVNKVHSVLSQNASMA